MPGSWRYLTVNSALLQKANIAAVNAALERVERGHQGFASKEELASKSDMKDVCALVDVKVGVDDVNQALAEVSRELEAKASVSMLEASIREQGVINSSLCAECSVGRWIWKSGQVKPGNGVPWNVQSVNTDPENFVWEKDKVSILTMAPGLYEVTFGFFTRKKPAIQLLVNGRDQLHTVPASKGRSPVYSIEPLRACQHSVGVVCSARVVGPPTFSVP